MRKSDWPEVKNIYEEGIQSGLATFETESPDWESWDKNHFKECRIAAIANNKIAGWCALSPVSKRYVYRGVAEVSIYLKNEFKGKGIGKKLMQFLINEAENAGFWTLQSVMFPENEKSIKLHKELGFRTVGFREKIGMLNNSWRDTLLLEYRSKKEKFK